MNQGERIMESIKAFLKKRRRVLRLIQLFFWWSSAFGIEPRKFIFAVRGFPIVLKDYFGLKKQNESDGLKWNLKFSYPCLHDRYESSGTASGHYFHQDLLVARRIFTRQPVRHVDVGSRVDGFVAHVATFRPIEVLDIRPLTTNIPNIVFRQCDLMNLPSDLVGYCDSLSCLHALEHFGLGRYGDPLDINGHLRGFDGLYKMLQQNGILYLSFPIGTERIEFNTHRVFAIKTVIEWAKSRFELTGFSYVDDKGDLHENVILDDHALSDSLGLRYGCGIFEFRKV
jgi:hypothetical protein